MSSSTPLDETNDFQPGNAPEPTLSRLAPSAQPSEHLDHFSVSDDVPVAQPLSETLPRETYGKFKLESVIASGGMGMVYEAYDVNLKRRVALKVMKDCFPGDSEKKQRFMREVQIAAHLKHPHIVEILEFGEVDEIPYFAMTLAQGGNLMSWLKAHPTDQRGIVILIEQICRAVHFAHEQGIMHRDLKPSNVLMTGAGVPLLADFGLAKYEDHSPQLTSTNAVLGSPHYMAPEQIRGSKHVTPMTDVWAVGVMLYELLAGKMPFTQENRLALFEMILYTAPPRPRAIHADLPVELERIILHCLEKLPEDRYPSALKLAEDLAAWLRGEVHRRSWRDRLRPYWRAVCRHPRYAALGGLLLPIGLLWIVLNWGWWDPYRALYSEMAALQSGQPVTLIDAVGPPKYWVEKRGRVEIRPHQLALRPFEIRTMGTALVELFPSPPAKHFRLDAEMRHLGGDTKSKVGLFFNLCEHATALADVQSLYIFQFNDLRSLPSLPAPPSRPFARLDLACFSTFRSLQYPDEQYYTFATRFLPASQEQKEAAWRFIQIEVEETVIRAFADRSMITAISLNKESLTEEMLLHGIPLLNPLSNKYNPEIHLDSCLQATGSLGLFLDKAVAEVRNVRLTPLK